MFPVEHFKLQMGKWIPCGIVPAGETVKWQIALDGMLGISCRMRVRGKLLDRESWALLSPGFPLLIERDSLTIEKLSGRARFQHVYGEVMAEIDLHLEIEFSRGRVRRKLPDSLTWEMTS